MTNADLKRKLTIGTRIALIYRFKLLDIPIIKIVNFVQTNGIYLKTEGMNIEGKKGSYLGFYPASLTEADEKGLRLYGIGERPVDEKEKAIIAGYEAIRDRKQEEIDALSDGSTTFWQEKAYYARNNADYLFGGYTSHGNRFIKRKNFNSPNSVYDPAIKGNLELEYQWL